MNIAVFGLGKLGAPLAAILASKGHDVVGYDPHPPVVDEPGLAELTAETRPWLIDDPTEAAELADVIFIVVPTPVTTGGDFSVQHVLDACRSIGQAIARGDAYKLVVIVSTVAPGTTRTAIVPALERASKKKAGQHFGVCYNPEFIALGNVIQGILSPDFVLIGESDQKAGDLLQDIYEGVLKNDAPIKRMAFDNAELCKLALNTFVTTKISYANMLSQLCERVPGGNIDQISDALGCDRRIGRAQLTGATAYGGPCFPRDNKVLCGVARRLGISADIAEATDAINHQQIQRLVQRIQHTVGILGLSYKPDTHIVEESTGLQLAELLSNDVATSVVVYDPMAMRTAQDKLAESVQFVDSVESLVRASDTVVIATPWPQFKTIDPAWLKPGANILDCWGLLDPATFGTQYIRLGVNYG